MALPRKLLEEQLERHGRIQGVYLAHAVKEKIKVCVCVCQVRTLYPGGTRDVIMNRARCRATGVHDLSDGVRAYSATVIGSGLQVTNSYIQKLSVLPKNRFVVTY